jgi:hypothetical protein
MLAMPRRPPFALTPIVGGLLAGDRVLGDDGDLAIFDADVDHRVIVGIRTHHLAINYDQVEASI